MIVASEHQAKLRQKEIQEIDKKASKEHEEAKKNSNFTQTYPKGWQRIRELVRDKTGCCRYRSLLIFRGTHRSYMRCSGLRSAVFS